MMGISASATLLHKQTSKMSSVLPKIALEQVSQIAVQNISACFYCRREAFTLCEDVVRTARLEILANGGRTLLSGVVIEVALAMYQT